MGVFFNKYCCCFFFCFVYLAISKINETFYDCFILTRKVIIVSKGEHRPFLILSTKQPNPFGQYRRLLYFSSILEHSKKWSIVVQTKTGLIFAWSESAVKACIQYYTKSHNSFLKFKRNKIKNKKMCINRNTISVLWIKTNSLPLNVITWP